MKLWESESGKVVDKVMMVVRLQTIFRLRARLAIYWRLSILQIAKKQRKGHVSHTATTYANLKTTDRFLSFLSEINTLLSSFGKANYNSGNLYLLSTNPCFSPEQTIIDLLLMTTILSLTGNIKQDVCKTWWKTQNWTWIVITVNWTLS